MPKNLTANRLDKQFSVVALINNDSMYRSIVQSSVERWWKFNKGAEKLRLYTGRDASGNRIGLVKTRSYKGKTYNYKKGRIKNVINFYETGQFQTTLRVSFNADNSVTYDSDYRGTRQGFQSERLINKWVEEYGDNIFRPSDNQVENLITNFIEPDLMSQVDKAVEWLNSEL